MLPSTAVVIRGSHLSLFCNKPFKAFKAYYQISKDKPIPLLAKKPYPFNMTACHLFYMELSFSVQYLFSISVTKSR